MVTMQYPASSYPPILSTLFPSTFLPTFLSTLFPSSFLPACGLSILHTLLSDSHLTLPYISSLLQYNLRTYPPCFVVLVSFYSTPILPYCILSYDECPTLSHPESVLILPYVIIFGTLESSPGIQ